LVGIGFGSGYLLGNPATATKRVLSLGTGQRNIAAAMIVALQNFYDGVLVMVVVFEVIILVVAIPLAEEWGRRSRKALAANLSRKEK
jgi:BASS family bile acid:Na+ symporter